MNEIAKSQMKVDGNTVNFSMPFAKVDKKQRLVSGFATLDNLDTQDDVVSAEASARAFARARGNIREMHQPLAVGRMVDFMEKEYYDQESGEIYQGIYVTARVSEGAEDTWKKVLDGTLTGFSIGGNINEVSNEFSKSKDKSYRLIKDYDLVELSLVDNPANQLANVLSIEKTATGSVVKGMAVETKIESVFVCPANDEHDSDFVTVRETETEECPLCGKKMKNAGWFESGADRTEKVRVIVEKFLTPEQEVAPISNEGGVVMGTEEKSTTVEEEVVETPAPEAVEPEQVEEVAGTEEEPTEEVVETPAEEEAETPEEVADEGEVISKAIDDLKESVTTSLEKTRNETAEQIAALEAKVDEARQEYVSKFSELDQRLSGFGEKLDTAKNRLAELEDSLEKMNSAEAVRKSADLSDDDATLTKNVQDDSSWNGAFSGKRTGAAPRFPLNHVTN